MSSVLVVDDEDQVRQLIRATLEQAGYQVREARDGKEALYLYRQKPVDLVIMDILMPVKMVWKASLRCAENFPWSRSLPSQVVPT